MSKTRIPSGNLSLRARYLTVAAFLALLIVASAWTARGMVADTSHNSSNNIEARNQVLQHSRLIRNALLAADTAMKAYMLSPSRDQLRATHDHHRTAIAHVEQLSRLPWVQATGQQGAIEALHADLLRLHKQSRRVMEIRSDTESLFPAVRIMRNELSHANLGFHTAATLAMEETAQGATPAAAELHELFRQCRYDWNRLIAAFRLYISSRAGIFGEPGQEADPMDRNVQLYYRQVAHNLDLLEERERSLALGLQAGQSLREMRQLARDWLHAYEELHAINKAEGWRSDVPILRNIIEPLYDAIWERLQALDERIETGALQDVTTWSNVASSITRALWVLAAVLLLFIAAGYAYLESAVLRPIAMVTRALKAGFAADPGPRHTNLRETRELFDAFSEMHNEVRHRQHALEHQATHDSLTGLPNRSLLQDRLNQAVHGAHRNREIFALLLMDLDRFKEINDTLGHHMGDWVLQQLGVRLGQLLRESDTVAQLGGDEFAVLLPRADEEHSQQVARKLLQAMNRAFEVGERDLYLGASVGIALYPRHGEDAATLIRHADVAMYTAKRTGADFALYDAEQDHYSARRLTLASDLREAIAQETLELYYQPKLELQTRRAVSAEALLRWKHPDLGFIPPAEIITIAEQTAQIRALTGWVLETALRQCARWRETRFDLGIAVNLSPWNLQDPGLVDQVGALLADTGVEAGCLELELTESAMMADPARAMKTLKQLDGMGVRLAIDDFGTGFSSLSYLKRLPVNVLKIDRSFIMDMTEDENDAVIVRSMIDLAHNLGLCVVAEGVEHEATWDLLRILGCDTAQGYHMSRALPAADLEKWLDCSYSKPE